MIDHWTRFPPVHVTAALFAGIKAPEKPIKPIANAWQGVATVNDAQFAAMLKPGIAVANVRLPK